MEESILSFNKQLKYRPEVKNNKHFHRFLYKSYILCGMGGSHLAADFLKDINNVDIHIHSDYDLPKSYDDQHALFIISSFSGNTEEAISSYYCAKSKHLSMLVITSDSDNSKLLKLAKKNGTPYIALTNMNIQPRMGLGLFLRALAYVCNHKLYNKLGRLVLDQSDLQDTAKHFANLINNKTSIIYTSNSSKSIGYNWKIKLNETAKVPAFCNVFPELNHNEMMGFSTDGTENSRKVNEFVFIFIYDNIDNRITRRMDILFDQLKNLDYHTISLNIDRTPKKRLESILLADWVSYYIAKDNKIDPEQVKMIEDFKKLLRD